MALLARGTRAHTLVLSGRRESSVFAAGGATRRLPALRSYLASPTPRLWRPDPSVDRAVERKLHAVRQRPLSRGDPRSRRRVHQCLAGLRGLLCGACPGHDAGARPPAPALVRNPAWGPLMAVPGARDQSRLLARQTVVLLGLGAIGLRLAELLSPLSARRSMRSAAGSAASPGSASSRRRA